MKNWTEWYFIMGILTVIIGIYRNLKGKQTFEPDELTTFSWFILWWVWLPYLGGRLFYTKIINKNKKKNEN